MASTAIHLFGRNRACQLQIDKHDIILYNVTSYFIIFHYSPKRLGLGGYSMGDKALSRREREKLRQRYEMLTAALELFSEKGFHNVSMHEIAQKAEFAIGTVYKFFKNKEDLYKSLLISKAQEFHDRLMEVLSKQDDPQTLLKDYIVTKGEIFADNVAVIRLYLAETSGASFNLKAGLDQDLRHFHEKSLERLSSLFAAGIREKIFRKFDPYYMAVALDGLTNAFLFSWLEDPEAHPYEKNVAMITELFFEGMLNK